MPTGASLSRRLLEGGGCAPLIALLWGLDTLSLIEARARTCGGLDDVSLYTEQATSALAALPMVPLVARWLGRFPLQSGHWVRSIPAHLLGTVLFTAGHYAAMVALGIVVFRLAGREYLDRHDPPANLAFEYTKDVKICLGILVVIASYRRQRRGRPDGRDSRAALPGAAAGSQPS